MYSGRHGPLVDMLRSQAFEELREVGSGELPFEGFGENFGASLEGEDVGGELVERSDVWRREDFTLEDREIDLDLIQPAGVDGKIYGHQVLVGLSQAPDGGTSG